ncbi:hypothetical protein [Aliarcobacter butzleri]|uniref:hypothetical protein n=1 Tax=Aliarcobacter butzleri TaxID=28197 RepID=UPI003AFA5887
MYSSTIFKSAPQSIKNSTFAKFLFSISFCKVVFPSASTVSTFNPFFINKRARAK